MNYHKLLMLHALSLALVGAVFFATSANADSLDVIVASKHDTAGFNESNPGLAYIADNGVVVGAYKNSYSVTSVYLGYAIETHSKYLNVGVVGGAITGYEQAFGYSVMPMVMPYVLVGPKAVRLKVGILPGALTFMLNIEL